MTRIATSSWSLHRTLGASMYQWPDPKGEPVLEGTGQGDLTLSELPEQLASRGIGLLEICHFHFPRLDDGYISQLRRALADSGVELFSVLIDAGDIVHPDAARRAKEVAWVREWMEIAARCGAQCVRVIAGEASDGKAVQVSAENLRAFASFGRTLGLGVMTENFRTLGTSVGALNTVLDLCDGEVGLCADFGNFKGPDKYSDLAAILPRATSVHAKADFSEEGQMDREDFVRCLRLTNDAGFAGPYSLIFSSPGDEWEGIAKTREVVEEWL